MNASPLPSLETVTFHGLRPGPSLVISGAVHGNEVCGPKAIERAIGELRSGRIQIERGAVTFIPVVNALAYSQNKRGADRDLNRKLAEKPIPCSFEDKVANVFCAILREHDVLVDLHSFSADGKPFALIGPNNNNEDLEPFSLRDAETALAQSLGVPMIFRGWLPAHQKATELKSTLADNNQWADAHGVGSTEYMRFCGGYSVTVECGNHLDPYSVTTAYKVILNSLAHLRLVDAPQPTTVGSEMFTITDVLISKNSGDHLAQPFATGDTFKADEIIAIKADGAEIPAPYNGVMIFPNPNAEINTELCFLGQLYG